MILVLTCLLLSTCIGIAINKNINTETDVIEEPIVEEPTVKDYKGIIINDSNVPSDVLNTITDYFNVYYSSLAAMQEFDASALFSNEVYKQYAANSLKLMLETRKQYDFDFGMSKASYDLNIVDYENRDGKYYVTLLQDEHLCFNFLNGIESECFEVRCEFVLDSNYLISYFFKEQGFFNIFMEEGEQLSVAKLNEKYDYYLDRLTKQITYNNSVLKHAAANENYRSEKTFNTTYDRNAAVAYLDKYYHQRNKQWYDFSDEGGNCQNLASQALYAGGIPMDYEGEQQWKCYIIDPEFDPEVNEEEEDSGRSRSWVNVGYFYDYALANTGRGLVAENDVNIYYSEPGDIIQVGLGSLSHTTMVSKVVDGHILVSSNSIDTKDYPIEAYNYTDIKLIKILGYNK